MVKKALIVAYEQSEIIFKVKRHFLYTGAYLDYIKISSGFMSPDLVNFLWYECLQVRIFYSKKSMSTFFMLLNIALIG